MSLHTPILAPSILAGDHAHLAASMEIVAQTGLSWAHLDIMDGHFVPNLSFGPQTVADLRKVCDLFFDVHLMLDEPQRYIEAFAKSGANLISVHVEPTYAIVETLEKIRELGCLNGIVLNPDTPAESILPFLGRVDLVLVMTVQPGFGGQSFRHDVLAKISQIDRWRNDRSLQFRLEVDGGVDAQTAPLCRERGCDTFVAGTAFFQAGDKLEFARSIEE